MKRREILLLKFIIEESLKIVPETAIKFRYGLLKNKNIVMPEFKLLKEMEDEYRKEVEEFDKQRDKLIMELGKRQEDGSTLIPKEDKEAMEKFQEKLKPLQKKYKTELDSYDKKIADYQKDILDAEMEEVPATYKISIDLVPEVFAQAGHNLELFDSLVSYGIIAD